MPVGLRTLTNDGICFLASLEDNDYYKNTYPLMNAMLDHSSERESKTTQI
jgi:hypothetical protein